MGRILRALNGIQAGALGDPWAQVATEVGALFNGRAETRGASDAKASIPFHAMWIPELDVGLDGEVLALHEWDGRVIQWPTVEQVDELMVQRGYSVRASPFGEVSHRPYSRIPDEDFFGDLGRTSPVTLDPKRREALATLGLPEDGASMELIKRAYRKLARELHPDVNHEAGAQEMFESVTRAYELLTDPPPR